MGKGTGLPLYPLRKRKRERRGKPIISLNVDKRAFEKCPQPADDTAKTNNDSVWRWVNYWVIIGNRKHTYLVGKRKQTKRGGLDRAVVSTVEQFGYQVLTKRNNVTCVMHFTL